jgi:hypothetical protein
MHRYDPTNTDEAQGRLGRMTKTEPCGLHEDCSDENGESRCSYFNDKNSEMKSRARDIDAAPDSTSMSNGTQVCLRMRAEALTFQCDVQPRQFE